MLIWRPLWTKQWLLFVVDFPLFEFMFVFFEFHPAFHHLMTIFAEGGVGKMQFWQRKVSDY